MESLVVTVIGKDRPGLVESVSAVIEDAGASWVESRMAHLAGHFAGILRASVPADKVEALTESLQALTASGLRIAVERSFEASEPRGNILCLELIGGDRPGIVHKVAEALATRNVNVEELETECDGAPWSGDALFKAKARLRAPASLDLGQLRDSLEAIAADLMVDITLGETE